jgi:lipoprotein-releasing system permease protein
MPQASIFNRDGVADYEALIASVKKNDSRILAAAPFVQIQGLVSFQKHVAPVNLFGVDPAQESKLSNLKQFLPPNAFNRIAADVPSVILGQGVADKLHATEGEHVSLIVSRTDGEISSPNVLILEVVAVLRSNTNIDQTLALMNINTAAKVSGLAAGRVSGVRLQVDDLFSAKDVVLNAVHDLPEGYFGSDWTRTHGAIYEAIHMSKQLISLLLFLIIGIAAFNLISTLIMVVVDKQGDIAILRTLGASSKEITGIFMIQGGLIGLVGTFLGGVLGVCFSLVVTDFIAGLEGVLGIQFLHSDVYPISYLPSCLYWSDVFFVMFVSLMICFFSSLYPALRASRILPADALRYE